MSRLDTIAHYTYIDVWLPATRGPDGLRANHDAAKNLPRLEAFLRELAALVGGALSAEDSQLYRAALTDTGFQIVEGGREGSAHRKYIGWREAASRQSYGPPPGRRGRSSSCDTGRSDWRYAASGVGANVATRTTLSSVGVRKMVSPRAG